MKSIESNKRRLILPNNFQQVTLMHEMFLKKAEVDADTIRKLIYLYSLGMEFYDPINQAELHKFYFDKFNKLLQNQKIITILDKYPIKLKEMNQINLFDEDPYHILKFPNREEVSHDYERVQAETQLPYSVPTSSWFSFILAVVENSFPSEQTMKKKRSTISEYKLHKVNNLLFKNKIKSELESIDLKSDKLKSNFSKNISEQATQFEEIKKKKMEKLLNSKDGIRLIKKKPPKVLNEEQCTNYSSSQSNLYEDETPIRSNFKFKKKFNKQSPMFNEVEEFIEKNMREMFDSIEEIKFSFKDEINSVDENLWPDVVKGLRDDMIIEIEILKNQYEEHRKVEVEKIRVKYFKSKWCK